jgi:hypothetical protein
VDVLRKTSARAKKQFLKSLTTVGRDLNPAVSFRRVNDHAFSTHGATVRSPIQLLIAPTVLPCLRGDILVMAGPSPARSNLCKVSLLTPMARAASSSFKIAQSGKFKKSALSCATAPASYMF